MRNLVIMPTENRERMNLGEFAEEPLPVLFPVYASGQKMVKKGGPAVSRAALR